ncbi:Imm30 family immunity protein [Pontibacillus marinus]|uniref:Immunity protein 30 domain-containing protein n=1 Tax=Pontibacillus marinus BH030004 = DSM 16465 TaxID=1385511 RepID=A0A0A5HKH5_9BACI|nr:Imm30 family immunity protein [Pontibacillus marinus]KGX84137.1 hypothetical protein N783_18835 [Pontibacillus marinus BH030004 = DSM 16465]
MNIDKEIKKLMNSRLLKREEDIKIFEDAIINVLNKSDVTGIRILCYGFYDETENDEAMFSLIHAIESYDKTYPLEDTLTEFATAVPNMIPHAREWAKTIHKRILNDPVSLETYVKVVAGIDEKARVVIMGIIKEIRDKKPSRFKSATDLFLKSNFNE